MRIGNDTNCFMDKFSMKEMVKIQADAGFDAIDFSFLRERYYSSEISDEAFREKFTELRKIAEDNGVCFNQAHAPNPSMAAGDEQNKKNYYNIVRSMKNASYLGADIIVIHPIHDLDYQLEGNPERLFEANMDFYNSLKPYCEEYGVRVALENIPKLVEIIPGQRFFDNVCSTPDEFIRYMDNLNNEWFVACFDIGHSIVLRHDPSEFIRRLGNKRLKALHIHDSDGFRDSHTLPYHGGMADWDKITDALKDINYTGDFNFEAGNFLVNLPCELYPIGAKMIAETGRYLVEKIMK